MTENLKNLKSVLKSLIISAKDILTIHELNNDFEHSEGEQIPFEFYGFKSLEEFLRSLTDTLRIKGFGKNARVFAIANEKVVQQQKRAKKIKWWRARKKTINKSNTKSSTTIKGPDRENNVTKPDADKIPFSFTIKKDWNKPPAALVANTKENVEDKNSADSKICFKTRVVKENEYDTTLSDLAASTENDAGDDDKNSADSKKYLKTRVVKENEYDTTLSDLAASTEHNAGDDDKNSADRKKCLKTRVVKENGYDTTLSDLAASTENDAGDDADVDDEVKVKDTKTTTTTTWNNKYCKPQQAMIEWKPKNNNNGAATITEVQVQEPQKGVVVDQNKSIQKADADAATLTLIHPDDEAIPNYVDIASIFMQLMPKEYMRFGQKIPFATITENILSAAFINVYVTEVFSPFQIWLYHPDSNKEALEHFQNNIAEFYEQLQHKPSYKMPRVLIKPGMCCAAIFCNEWHRAEILSELDSQNKAKVFFVDFGTVYKVDIDDIMYLSEIFGDTPAYALRACLTDIEPIGEHWSMDATLDLIDIVHNLRISAIVSDIDFEQRILYLTLHDGYDINISDVLIQKKYAKPQKNTLIQDERQREKHIRELLPTFDMLEQWIYPSLKEIYYALEQNVDLESYFDQIFLKAKDKAFLFEIKPNNPFFRDIMNDFLKVPSSLDDV